jgi:hypothetical protein
MTDLTRRWLIGVVLSGALVPQIELGRADAQERAYMKIRVKFHDQDFTATLHDNASAREFASMLPLDLKIGDFSTNEKVPTCRAN